jgi:redox-sensing transcriptional repressor
MASQLAETGRATVSSRQLADSLGLTAAQVRKDLAHFGQLGRPGVGYQVTDLVAQLRRLLGTDRVRQVALVGVGSLGRALLGHKGFRKKGFRISAAFDGDPRLIGRRFGEVTVRAMGDMPETVRGDKLGLAILAVPAESAQDVADQLCRAGIHGILNFAPVQLNLPDGVAVVPVDLAVQLEQLGYFADRRER